MSEADRAGAGTCVVVGVRSGRGVAVLAAVLAVVIGICCATGAGAGIGCAATVVF